MRILISGNIHFTSEQKDIISGCAEKITYHKNEIMPVVNPEDYEYVICNNLFRHNDITKFRSLQAIQLTSAGIDEKLLKYTQKNNICLYNAENVYSSPIAEHTIMQILNIYRNTRFSIKNQENRIWEKDRELKELTEKRICIVGFGNVGREIAKRLDAFGCKIAVVNRTEIKAEKITYYPLNGLNRAAAECDVLIIAIAESEETRNLIDKKIFDCMKPTSILVNVARGSIVNEKDLIYALGDRNISAAALDVFCREPLDVKSALWGMPNVYITPHNAFIGDKVNDRLFDVIVKNLKITKGNVK